MKKSSVVIKYAIAMFFGIALILPATYLARITSDTHAAVTVDGAGKLKLFGDARIRLEPDKQIIQNGEDAYRERTRFRARFGMSFAPNDSWPVPNGMLAIGQQIPIYHLLSIGGIT